MWYDSALMRSVQPTINGWRALTDSHEELKTNKLTFCPEELRYTWSRRSVYCVLRYLFRQCWKCAKIFIQRWGWDRSGRYDKILHLCMSNFIMQWWCLSHCSYFLNPQMCCCISFWNWLKNTWRICLISKPLEP